jgi:hypothetical protein
VEKSEKKAQAPRKVAQGTGRFQPCPMNTRAFAHRGRMVACEVFKGPKAFWFACPLCKTRVYIGTSARWVEGLAYDYDDAVANGMDPM